MNADIYFIEFRKLQYSEYTEQEATLVGAVNHQQPIAVIFCGKDS